MKRTPMVRTAFKPTAPKPPAGPKLVTCRACRQKFTPERPRMIVCGPVCAEANSAADKAKQQRKAAKAERAATKAAIQAIEPLQYWLARAEKAFNAYIRKRDEGQGCISCGRKNADVYNAGHFVSVGANRSLRFNEDNVHLQCARPCNKDKGGNIHEYRKALLIKIGADRLAALDGWWPPEKMTREKAQGIESGYRAKLKQLQQEK